MSVGLGEHECPPKYAHDLARLEQRKVEGDRRDAGGEPDHQEATLPVQRPDRRLSEVAAHRVINNVDAAASGRLDLALQLFLLSAVEGSWRIDDAGVGAVSDTEVNFFLTGAAGNDGQAHRLAELNRGESDATGSAEDEQ